MKRKLDRVLVDLNDSISKILRVINKHKGEVNEEHSRVTVASIAKKQILKTVIYQMQLNFLERCAFITAH